MWTNTRIDCLSDPRHQLVSVQLYYTNQFIQSNRFLAHRTCCPYLNPLDKTFFVKEVSLTLREFDWNQVVVARFELRGHSCHVVSSRESIIANNALFPINGRQRNGNENSLVIGSNSPNSSSTSRFYWRQQKVNEQIKAENKFFQELSLKAHLGAWSCTRTVVNKRKITKYW